MLYDRLVMEAENDEPGVLTEVIDPVVEEPIIVGLFVHCSVFGWIEFISTL